MNSYEQKQRTKSRLVSHKAVFENEPSVYEGRCDNVMRCVNLRSCHHNKHKRESQSLCIRETSYVSIKRAIVLSQMNVIPESRKEVGNIHTQILLNESLLPHIPPRNLVVKGPCRPYSSHLGGPLAGFLHFYPAAQTFFFCHLLSLQTSYHQILLV